MIGAVTQQIGFGIGGDGADDFDALGWYPVDRGAGKLGHRHGVWTDILDLRVPFLGDGFHQGAVVQDERCLGGGPDGLAVQMNHMAAFDFSHCDLFVKPLHLSLHPLRFAASSGLVQQIQDSGRHFIRRQANALRARSRQLFHLMVAPGDSDRSRSGHCPPSTYRNWYRR